MNTTLPEPQQDIFGTAPHKLSRADGPTTSRDAGNLVDTTDGEQAVYELLRKVGSTGLTIKEAAMMLNKSPHQISGRFTALQHDKDLIADSKRRRRGRSRVMVLKRYAPPEDQNSPTTENQR